VSYVDIPGTPPPTEAELSAYLARLEIVRGGGGPLFTFGQWLSARPFGAELPDLGEARRLEIAFTAGMRRGRESEPPGGKVPGE
jgi:hypothetical protein